MLIADLGINFFGILSILSHLGLELLEHLSAKPICLLVCFFLPRELKIVFIRTRIFYLFKYGLYFFIFEDGLSFK